MLFLFIFFSMFFVLIHDYTLCFTGSHYCKFSYCKFSYYNYISIWPYYIVNHLSVSCGLLSFTASSEQAQEPYMRKHINFILYNVLFCTNQKIWLPLIFSLLHYLQASSHVVCHHLVVRLCLSQTSSSGDRQKSCKWWHINLIMLPENKVKILMEIKLSCLC